MHKIIPFLISFIFIFSLFQTNALAFQNIIRNQNVSLGGNGINDLAYNGTHIAVISDEGGSPNTKHFDLIRESDFAITSSCTFTSTASPIGLELSNNNLFYTKVATISEARNFSCNVINSTSLGTFSTSENFLSNASAITNNFSTEQVWLVSGSTQINKKFLGNGTGISSTVLNPALPSISQFGEGFDVSNDFAYFVELNLFNKLFVYNTTTGIKLNEINLNTIYGLSDSEKAIASYENNTASKKLTWLTIRFASGIPNALYGFFLVDLNVGINESVVIQAISPENTEIITETFTTLQARVNSANNGTVMFFLDNVNIGNQSYITPNISTDLFFATGTLTEGNHTWFGKFISINNATFDSNSNTFTVSTGLAETIGSIFGDVFGVSNSAGLNLFAIFLTLAISSAIVVSMASLGATTGLAQVFIVSFTGFVLTFTFIGWVNIFVGIVLVIIAGFILVKMMSEIFM